MPRTVDPRALPSLNAEPRCAQTHPVRWAKPQCAGHWDYFGDCMVWTRHYRVPPFVRYKVVSYSQIAPEAISPCQ